MNTGFKLNGPRCGAVVLVLASALLLIPARPTLQGQDKPPSAGKSALPEDLALVTADAMAFAHIRIGDLWNSDLAKAMRRQFPREADRIKDTLKKSLGGLQPEEVERLTFISWKLPDLSGPPAVAGVGMGRPAFGDYRYYFNPFNNWNNWGGQIQIDDIEVPIPPSVPGGQGQPGMPAPAYDVNSLDLTVVRLAKPFKDEVLTKILGEWQQQTYKNKSYYVSKKDPERGKAFYAVSDRTYVTGSVKAVHQLIDRPAQIEPAGPLASTLALATARNQMVFGLGLSDMNSQNFKEMIAQLGNGVGPEAMLIRSLKPMFEARSAVLALEVGKDVHASVHLQYPDEAKAKGGRVAAQDAMVLIRIFGLGSLSDDLQGLRDMASKPEDEENAVMWSLFAKKAEDFLRGTEVKQQGPAVQFTLNLEPDWTALRAEAKSVVKAGESDDGWRLARNRKKSEANLRQLALAMISYHDGAMTLPPAMIADKNGEPLLSWRVAILPQLGQQDLYQQFHLEEPWDSEHNKKLLTKMPAVYAPLGMKTKEPYSTFCQVFNGKGAAFENNLGLPLGEGFADGTSNTLLIVEAGQPVPWTKPDDLEYHADKELPKLSGLFKEGFSAAFADGSIRFIKKSIDEKTLRALITRSGGELVDLNKLP